MEVGLLHLVIMLVLGCDGVVGSLSKYDQCGVCRGDNSTCRLVSGLFTKPHLPAGYTHITTIPQGACSLNISFLRPNKNNFALKIPGNTYLINKPGVLSLTGAYEGVGTVFFYTRGDQVAGEHLTADGPIEKPVELELLVSDINRGVEYRYMVPISGEDELADIVKPQRTVGHKRRHEKRQYRWTLKTLTQCSRTCGGGHQRTIALCVKKSGHRVVPDRKCEEWNKPAPRTIRCNRNPCPADWIAGEWGECSTSCGEGVQERRVACRQELSESLSIPVAEELCNNGHNFVTDRKCYVKACESEFSVEKSTVPSVLATQAKGDFRYLYQNAEAKTTFNNLPYKTEANRAQRVFPYSMRNARKYSLEDQKPRNEKVDSDSQVDNRLRSSQTQLSADWVAQPWALCSVTCGSGVKERRVHCVDKRGGLVPDARCNILSRPDSEAFCHAGPCVPNTWLVSQWDVCSAQCGSGKVHRKVTCLGECDENSKPHVKEDCHAPKPCKGEWLTGRWTVCSHSCGEGMQSRKVECTISTEKGSEIAPEENCADRRQPKVERRCNIQKCSAEWMTGEWSKCSQQCGEGEKTREVVCLHNYRLSEDCMRGEMPERTQTCEERKCEDASKKDETDSYSDVDSIEEEDDEEEEDYEENEEKDSLYMEETTQAKPFTDATATEATPFISNEIVPEKHWKMGKGDGCKDKFKNCNVVVQSRLCKYSFYQTNCCRSCMFINQP